MYSILVWETVHPKHDIVHHLCFSSWKPFLIFSLFRVIVILVHWLFPSFSFIPIIFPIPPTRYIHVNRQDRLYRQQWYFYLQELYNQTRMTKKSVQQWCNKSEAVRRWCSSWARWQSTMVGRWSINCTSDMKSHTGLYMTVRKGAIYTFM